MNETLTGNNTLPQDPLGTDEPLDYGDLVDLDDDEQALVDFFRTNDFNLTDYDQILADSDESGFIDPNGTVPFDEDTDYGSTTKRTLPQLMDQDFR